MLPDASPTIRAIPSSPSTLSAVAARGEPPEFERDAKCIHFASGALLFTWDWSEEVVRARREDDAEQAIEGLWRLTEAIGAVRTFVLGLCREFKAAHQGKCNQRGRKYSSAHLAMLDQISCLHAEVCAASSLGIGRSVQTDELISDRGNESANVPNWALLRENWKSVRNTIHHFHWSRQDADELRRQVQTEASLAILAIDESYGYLERARGNSGDIPLHIVHAGMVALMFAEPECKSWTAYEFAHHLGCEPNAVKATVAWKEILDVRIREGSAT